MAGSNQWNRPHRGSMQIWPRVRAARVLARVRFWPVGKDVKLQGFIGYKAGMTHIFVKEPNQFSHVKNQQLATAATIIECPPLKPYSIRFYKNTTAGAKLVSEMFVEKTEKELKRYTTLGKGGSVPEHFDDVKLVVYSQPKLTSTSKKTPDILEIAIGGHDAKQKLAYAQSLLDKDIKVSEILKEGQMLDIHGTTKGKGFQGTVKRFGVKKRQHKAEKTVRGVGTLGSWRPKRVDFTVAQPGKMGFHRRTELNKLCLIISDKPEKINQAGGIMNYGLVKGDYILVKGSVLGSAKRQIVLVNSTRPPQKFKHSQPEVSYISTSSKQGL